MSKALVSEARREGEVWRGPSGHYFTLKGGHVVPAKDPGGRGKAPPAGGAAPAKAAPTARGADVKAFFGGITGGAVSAGFYKNIADAIEKTGEVPTVERKGNVGRAWEMVKKAGLHTGPHAAAKFLAAVKAAYNKMVAGKAQGVAWSEALNETYPPAAHAASAASASAVAKIPPAKATAAVAKVRARADTPAGKAVLARADKWADAQAARHAARVAKHLGIDENSARFVLASTIKMLCRKALAGGAPSQSYTGASGKKITLAVKRKSPAATEAFDPTQARDDAGRWRADTLLGHADEALAVGHKDVARAHDTAGGPLKALRRAAALHDLASRAAVLSLRLRAGRAALTPEEHARVERAARHMEAVRGEAEAALARHALDYAASLPDAPPVSDPKAALATSVVDVADYPPALRPAVESLVAKTGHAQALALGTLRLVARPAGELARAWSALDEGAGFSSERTGDRLDDLWEASKAPEQIALSDLAAAEPADRPRYKRLSRDLVMRYDPASASVRVLSRAEAPQTVGAPTA